MKDSGRDGEDLVGQGREPGGAHRPHVPALVVVFHHPYFFFLEQLVQKGPAALITQPVAEHAAHYRGHRADQGEPEALCGMGHGQGHEEHIRGDGEEGAFSKGQGEQGPGAVGCVGEMGYPLHEAFYAFAYAVQDAVSLIQAVLPKTAPAASRSFLKGGLGKLHFPERSSHCSYYIPYKYSSRP